MTTFQDGSAEAVLEFISDYENSSLAIELPRGATVLDAQLTLEPVPYERHEYEWYDFNTTKRGADLWAKFECDLQTYPPSFDPYAVQWSSANEGEYTRLKVKDGSYWHVATSNQTVIKPPDEYPVQLYHFRPPNSELQGYVVRWQGYSMCKLNATSQYHCEMWLLNQSSDGWELVKSYSSQNQATVTLEYALDLPSAYVSDNGSIDVAMVGSKSILIQQPRLRYDSGHLYTDYMGLGLSFGSKLEYPPSLNMVVDGTLVYQHPERFDKPVMVGALDGLGDAIQSAIDPEEVRPGNLTIPLTFILKDTSRAKVRAGPLRVEYEPVVNHAPEWTGPSEVSLAEDSDWTSVMSMMGSFTDDFNEGALEYEVASISDRANLSARIVEDASPEPHLEVRPAQDFFGAVEVVMMATDLFGAVTESPPIQMTVTQVGDRPSLKDPGTMTVKEDDTLDITLEASDADLPDDELTFSDNSEWVEVDSVTGRILWTPSDEHVGVHSFGVFVEDRFGLDTTLLLRIIVENVNDRPWIVSELNIQVVQDDDVTYDILVDDPDIAHGDVLTYYAYSELIDVGFDEETGRVTFNPGNEHVPSVTITLIVDDALGTRAEEELVVEVENVNDPPSIASVASAAADQGEEVTLQLTFDDPDLHLAPGSGADEALSLTVEGPDVMGPDELGRVCFTPGQDLVGTWSVTYIVTDQGGLTDRVEVVFEVRDVNDDPVIETQVEGQVDADEDDQFTMDLVASDVDGDDLIWTDDSPMFEIGSVTGSISFTPLQANVGVHPVTVTVSDGRGGFASLTFDLFVHGVNDPPVVELVVPANGSTFSEGESISFAAHAVDEDGDDLTYIWHSAGRELGQGPNMACRDLSPGTHRVVLMVSDGTTNVERELTLTVVDDASVAGEGLLMMLVIILVAVVACLSVLLVRRGGGGAGQADVGTGEVAGSGEEARPEVRNELDGLVGDSYEGATPPEPASNPFQE